MTVFTLGQATARALGKAGASLGAAAGSRGVTAESGARHARMPHRTGAPVLRDSIEAGTFEALFFAVPAKGETDKLLRIARRTLDAGRQLRREARAGDRILTAAERRIVTLTAAAVRVYEEILTLARLNRGRVFPSYDHLSAATSLGRATIARALHILEDIGFLVRQRRFKRVDADGPGPRYRQTSNAYRATLPQRVLGFMPRWMRPAPLPDDVVQRETDRTGEVAAMLEGLSCRELATATVGGPLGRMLAKLGAGIDRRECESQNNPQPLLN
jgi:predicted transcriptional regulator